MKLINKNKHLSRGSQLCDHQSTINMSAAPKLTFSKCPKYYEGQLTHL